LNLCANFRSRDIDNSDAAIPYLVINSMACVQKYINLLGLHSTVEALPNVTNCYPVEQDSIRNSIVTEGRAW